MTVSNTRGRGGARQSIPAKPIPPYGISPQMAPTPLTSREKAAPATPRYRPPTRKA